ncbi:hypothetical protein [Tsukamurella paurometabola]|uniref:Uncharacterized protein n=1 Tax=Tsukamurella paurometabola TaxID=2061 RepID=A0ABS5NEU2_TSUPA|nr:hypothetical protein [Tsukamurella paurometabola]MBS4102453.1 hypothetical protein [Tsukamurella paurometabola]
MSGNSDYPKLTPAELADRRDPIYIERRLVELEHDSTFVIPNVLADAEKTLTEAEMALARAEGKLSYPAHVKTIPSRHGFSLEALPQEHLDVLVAKRAHTYAKALADGVRREIDSLRSRLSFAKTEFNNGRN